MTTGWRSLPISLPSTTSTRSTTPWEMSSSIFSWIYGGLGRGEQAQQEEEAEQPQGQHQGQGGG